MASGQWGGGFDQRIFRATIAFTRGGQRCQTGFHLRDVGINNLEPDDVADEVAEWATTQFIKLLHNGDQIMGIDVMNLETKEGHSISPTNVLGTHTGYAAPSFVSVSVALKGSIRRRYGSGRMLWPVPVVDAMAGNLLNGTYATNHYGAAVTDLLARFVGPSITTSMHLVHAHEALPAAANRPAVPASWYDVTSIRVNTTLSSLRRRKQGVGS